jgi:cobaltochelatase CobN
MQDFWGRPQDRGPSILPAKKTDKKLLPTIGGKIVSIDVEEPWGDEDDYLFAAMDLGNALIALQPPRGYGIDPDAIYHTPDLPPTHHYCLLSLARNSAIRRRMGRGCNRAYG